MLNAKDLEQLSEKVFHKRKLRNSYPVLRKGFLSWK